jgi:hypothetical protein
MYLHNGWMQFTRANAVKVRHVVVFNHDGHDMLTVKVFDETIFHRHYHTDEDN